MKATCEAKAYLRGVYRILIYVYSATRLGRRGFRSATLCVHVVADNGTEAAELVRLAISEVRPKGQAAQVHQIYFLRHSDEPLTTYEQALGRAADAIESPMRAMA